MPATISTAPPPLPTPSSSILPAIEQSCSSAISKAGLTIDTSRLEDLLSEISASSPATAQDYSFAFPLKWDSTAAEVNFLSLLCTLSNLSPYQSHLSTISSSASSLPRQLLIGLYLSAPAENTSTSAGVPLSSSHLTSLGDGEIADLLRLKIHQEKRVEHIPVATLAERGGAGSDVVERIRRTCNRIGEAGIASRYVDLGAFVMETLRQCKQQPSDEAAVGHFIARLNTFLPQDVGDSHTVHEGEIHICKGPLYLLLALHLRFPPGSNALPWVPSAASIFSLIPDEVIPALLLQTGIVDLSTASDDALRKFNISTDDASADTATLIRAASVHVSALIRVKGLNPIDFDAFLRRKHRKQARTDFRPLTTRQGDREEVGNW